MFRLDNHIAVVTGGTHGNLGPIWVETLQSVGATTLRFDLPTGSVTRPSSIEHIRDVVRDIADTTALAGIILVNNAAIDTPPTKKASFFGDFIEIMDVNINGAISMCEAFIPLMVKVGKGIIVNIGSIQGYGGADWHNYEGDFEKPIGYNISKWGLRGLAKSITTQYGRYGVRAVTISFGCVDTPKIDAGFKKRFLSRVPLGTMVSKRSLQTTLLYACCCPELAGVDWRIDGGLGAWA